MQNKEMEVVKEAKKLTAKRPAALLLAHSTLSDHRVKRVIACYTQGMTPREAIATCQISHVTIYRLYGYIRARLLHVGIYSHLEDFDVDVQIAEDLTGRFPWQELNARIRRRLGEQRGVRHENKDTYFAEEYFRSNNSLTLAQINQLILLAVQSA